MRHVALMARRLVPFLLPLLALAVGAQYLPLLLMPVVAILVASAMRRRDDPPPGRSDGEDGWGRGPRRPTNPPDPPRGGIPLPDAAPARIRIRDHGRVNLLPTRNRRSAREPARAPTRTRPGGSGSR